MSDLLGTAWALPVFGATFGVIALASALYASREFDRRYGRNNRLHPGE